MWILYAVLNPVADASCSIFSKKASLNVNSLLVSWFSNLIPMILFSPFLFFIKFRFSVDFFIALLISGIINIIFVLVYHRAIAEGDISEVVPMTSFTPLFLLITSPFIVGEFPKLSGLIGILLIVTGSFLLNMNAAKESFFHPFKKLLLQKNTRYMLILAFILSFAANFDKRGILASSVFQYAFFLNLFATVVTTVILFAKGKFDIEKIRLEKKNLIMVGFLNWLSFLFNSVALSMTLVAYVIAIKRTNGMMSVLFGHFFFGEKNIKAKLLGSAVMLAGVLLIILI